LFVAIDERSRFLAWSDRHKVSVRRSVAIRHRPAHRVTHLGCLTQDRLIVHPVEVHLERPQLPAGLHHRPPVIDDAPAVASLIAACQQTDIGKPEMTTEELLQDWHGIDLAEEAVVVVDSGRIVGSADILNRSFVSVSVYGNVHPLRRGRGVGRFLVDWGEQWARDRMDLAPPDARVSVRHYLLATNSAARSLLAAAGYPPVRGVYVMEIDLGQPSIPQWPAGISVRTFIPGRDEHVAYETLEDAFRDHWGRPRGTFDRFLVMTQQPDFDPMLWFLAEADEETVGVTFARVVAGRGWVESVGVRRPWRGRGLALALLQHAFVTFYKRGIRNVGLSVDAESLTGAPRVYLRAGMGVTQSYVIHEKELRPGVDLGMQMNSGASGTS
jgi:mycothiol synthase